MQHRGRLAVFSPDGPIQNFFIEKATVAIGRSPGNDLMLDRHGISRYHASLTINEADRSAELRDLESVNGTYVDGIRLNPNDPRILRGGEEIQIGDLRLIFHPAADDTTDQTIQVRLQSAEAQHLSVELEGPNIPVTPGAHGPATISLLNKTNEKMRIVLRIEGVPPQWARLDQTEFDLLPEQQREVGINFKPIRRFDTKPGLYNITLHIGTIDTPYPPIELHTRLQILQFNGYGAVLGTPIIKHGGTFMLYVHNQGNGPLPLRFMGRDAEDALNYDLDPPQVVLEAGQRITVHGHVIAKHQPLVGKSHTLTYDIISQSLSPSAFVAPVSGQVEIAPLLSNWRIPVGVSAVLAVAVVLLVGLLFSQTSANGDDTNATMPQIRSFVVNSSAAPITVEVNEPILVQWQTQDATVVYLTSEQDDGPLFQYALAAQAPNGHVLYLSTAGDYRLTLDAVNGDLHTSSTTIAIEVIPQLSLQVYSVSSATTQTSSILHRNVNGQRIIVEWQANWGDTLSTPALHIRVDDRIFPIEDATGQLVVEPNGLQNRPEGISVALNTDTEILQTTTLPVLYPECLSQNGTVIYDGPDVNSPVVPLPSNTTFQVDGQNADGWIRVILPISQMDFGYWGWIAPDATATIDCAIDYAELGPIVNE